MTGPDRATSLFKEGFNCAQSLLAAYGGDYGMSPDLALKVAAALGGGGGRTGETCGAISGAFMVIGLKYGSPESRNKEAGEKISRLTAEFLKRFRSRNSSLSCRELLGFNIGETDHFNGRVSNIIAEKCPKFVRDSAEIIEEIF
jgi:C_GCAxxG_C_C family probable redox protein